MLGNAANPDLVQLSAGQLYHLRPSPTRTERICIYKDAVATIRRTDVKFQYQLVVAQAYEEGDEQDDTDDAEIDDEKSFLVDVALQFRFGEIDGDWNCTWRDIDGEDQLWEFVSSKSVPLATNKLFELTILNCVYERKHQTSHELAAEDDIAAIRTAMLQGDAPSVEEHAPVADPFKDVPVLTKTPAELYLFDTEADLFVVQENTVDVEIAANAEFDTWIIVRQNLTPFISVPIDSEMNPLFDMANYAFMFTFREQDGLPPMTWCLKFSADAFQQWKDDFIMYLWEGKNKMSYAKAKADERRYIQEAYEDVEMAEPEEEEEVPDEVEEEEPSEQSYVEDSDEGPSDTEQFAKGSKNEQLAVGYKNDLSFVARGDMIGVFAQKEDRIKFRAAIDRVKDTHGKSFSPAKMMLHNQDSDMLLLDPANSGSVYRMDLEYGKVVDEWKVHDTVQVNNIVPQSKYAQMNPEQTFLGTSHNGLFRIDPRVSGNKLVESQFKQYSTKNDFSAAATTESGRIAVASNKGDIRLFDQLGKNAKTALPALGDPILGVDVSADGRWLVATCKTYLLLIDTLIGDGRYKGSLGFDRSFPADSKPVPRRLQLKPEHVAYMNDPVSFTPARFNTGLNETERTIVTSTGRYVVTWNFRRIKQGRTDDYQIKQYDSKVVADNFNFGADRNIVVALEHNVLLANKKELSKPTRSSLASRAISTKPGKSRNDIVDSPY
ncbi:cytoplasmic protein [Tremella mesenterica]|uniref:Cytoplasmic protein n=1 Tax=Tremella mesenterica TaxID=5217 RepID=A0A4Q1BT08_TREME|nr:cytoplasmic protein [Tremella mesenterica]